MAAKGGSGGRSVPLLTCPGLDMVRFRDYNFANRNGRTDRSTIEEAHSLKKFKKIINEDKSCAYKTLSNQL